ncbi:MAG: hypothetical protein GTO40_17405 [Deltaproteobacteria bacterium]|nr:hypothetical protein [Deltaproteobacteria bacterium]
MAGVQNGWTGKVISVLMGFVAVMMMWTVAKVHDISTQLAGMSAYLKSHEKRLDNHDMDRSAIRTRIRKLEEQTRIGNKSYRRKADE